MLVTTCHVPRHYCSRHVCPTFPCARSFMLVTILGVRSKLVEFIPRSVMLATAAGIGALPRSPGSWAHVG